MLSEDQEIPYLLAAIRHSVEDGSEGTAAASLCSRHKGTKKLLGELLESEASVTSHKSILFSHLTTLLQLQNDPRFTSSLLGDNATSRRQAAWEINSARTMDANELIGACLARERELEMECRKWVEGAGSPGSEAPYKRPYPIEIAKQDQSELHIDQHFPSHGSTSTADSHSVREKAMTASSRPAKMASLLSMMTCGLLDPPIGSDS